MLKGSRFFAGAQNDKGAAGMTKRPLRKTGRGLQMARAACNRNYKIRSACKTMPAYVILSRALGPPAKDLKCTGHEASSLRSIWQMGFKAQNSQKYRHLLKGNNVVVTP